LVEGSIQVAEGYIQAGNPDASGEGRLERLRKKKALFDEDVARNGGTADMWSCLACCRQNSAECSRCRICGKSR
jgi:hypothetical protein